MKLHPGTMMASVAMSLVLGCLPDPLVSNDATHAGSNETPRQLFDATVMPLLSRCAGCHVGTETTSTDMFLGSASTSDSFYAGITGDRRINGGFAPANAELLTKGTHEGVTWWSSAEAQILTTWLLAESDARGSGSGSDVTGSDAGTGPGQSPEEAESQWASCLAASGSAYESTQVYQIANMIADQQACYSCHAPGGAGGAYWDTDKTKMLLRWQAQIFITAPFEVADSGATPVSYKMIAGRSKICAKGLEQKNNGGTHPAFDCEQTVNGIKPIDALDQFTAAVQANEDAGLCPAPGTFAPAM